MSEPEFGGASGRNRWRKYWAAEDSEEITVGCIPSWLPRGATQRVWHLRKMQNGGI